MTMIMSMMSMMSMMMVVMMTQQCKDVRAEQRVESPPDKLQLARAAQQAPHNEDAGQRCCDHHHQKKAFLHFTSLLLGLFLFTRPALMPKIRLTTDDCDL